MGTSTSHSGPISGVPFEPQWLDDKDDQEAHLNQDSPEHPSEDQMLAPQGRFRGARRNMSSFLKTGSRDSLRKALGHYSRTGMGGARRVARRMRHSARIASSLYTALISLQQGDESTLISIVSNYKAGDGDVYWLINIITEYICGDGGSLDEASVKNSVYLSLSDLFDKDPNVDLTSLSDDRIWMLVSSFLSYEAFSRIQLDIGQGFERSDTSLADRVKRYNDKREYLESEICIQINTLRNEIEHRHPSDLHEIMMKAIERTFRVFEVAI